MPKIKTHKSAKKRIVRITGTGKVMMRKMSISHRSRFKSTRAKRLASHNQSAAAGLAAKLTKLVGRQNG
ncbi:MAG: bL35 family ribosomal protein [Patescibacteria group bacterium]